MLPGFVPFVCSLSALTFVSPINSIEIYSCAVSECPLQDFDLNDLKLMFDRLVNCSIVPLEVYILFTSKLILVNGNSCGA